MMIFNGDWIGISFVLVLLYLIAGAIYRLYYSPLARFPGPKLAALTLWYARLPCYVSVSSASSESHRYEFYFDVIKNGRYTWEIKAMHLKYGT